MSSGWIDRSFHTDARVIAAGAVAIFLAVPAERRALEDVASPYTAVRGRGPSGIAAPAPAG